MGANTECANANLPRRPGASPFSVPFPPASIIGLLKIAASKNFFPFFRLQKSGAGVP
jgi:hypothetical protein